MRCWTTNGEALVPSSWQQLASLETPLPTFWEVWLVCSRVCSLERLLFGEDLRWPQTSNLQSRARPGRSSGWTRLFRVVL